MPVTKVVPDGFGGAWGWDTEARDWVPVDPQALEGSFVGNLARGAGRGFEGVGVGLRQAAEQGSEASNLEAESYRERTAAAERGAPWGETLGQAAPDIAAGSIAGALTGGASIPAQLLAQGAAGGLTAAARPGSTEERLANAAWGAGLAIAGTAIAPMALKGITAALEIGRGIQSRTMAGLADSVEAGGLRLERQKAMQAAAQQSESGALPEGGSSAPGGRSVGAAQTPDESMPANIRAENEAMDLDEAQGLTTGEWTPGQRKVAEDAQALGFEVPAHFGTARGSPSRIFAAGREFLPGNAEVEQGRIARNNTLKNRAFAKAAGFTDDIEDTRYNAIDDGMISRWQDRMTRQYEEVSKELPNIERAKINKLFDKIDDSEAPDLGGEAWNRVKSQIMGKFAASPKGHVSGLQFMRNTQAIGKEMAEAFKDGDQYSGEMLMMLQNSMFDLAEKETKQAPSRYGSHGRDPSITGKDWSALRAEANLFRMAVRPGSIGADGTINTRSLLNALRAEKKNGGFGRKGPPEDSRMRDLWKILQADNMSDTAVPATGARLAMQMARQYAPGAAIGLGALGGINSLWNSR